ncbi:MAG: hypothetical protein ABJA78_16410 [Ferruginibacter sp.]
MLVIPLLILIVLPISAWIAYIIGARTYKSLIKQDNKHPRLIQVIVSLVCFAALFCLITFVILINFRFSRE